MRLHSTAARAAIVCAAAALCVSTACEREQSAAGKTHAAPAGWTAYGAGVGAKKPVPVARVLAEPAKYDGKTVAIEGAIVEVCQAKGCWLTMQDGDKEMRVRFKDYAFFVPLDCAGKTARIEGVFARETIPVEDARHYLEDAGKHDEAAKITEAMDGFTFMASGVILHD